MATAKRDLVGLAAMATSKLLRIYNEFGELRSDVAAELDRRIPVPKAPPVRVRR